MEDQAQLNTKNTKIYTPEVTAKLIADYRSGVQIFELARELSVPERSIRAKLAHLGVYHKKEYRDKRGEIPVKKEEHIAKLAELLHTSLDNIRSLEKVNKHVLRIIEENLVDPKP